jgi:hypothetical protein
MLQDSSNLCSLECLCFIQKYYGFVENFVLHVHLTTPDYVDICLNLLKINIIEFVILSV